MIRKVDGGLETNYVGPSTQAYQPESGPQLDNTNYGNNKVFEMNYQAANLKAQLAAPQKDPSSSQPLSPSDALKQINDLPVPKYSDTPRNLSAEDRQAIYEERLKEYNQKRAEIADAALRNAAPPKLEDFKNGGLNGRTAELEYREAKAEYDRQIAELKKISQEAKAPLHPETPPQNNNPQTFINDKEGDLLSQRQVSPANPKATPEEAAAFLSYGMGFQSPGTQNALFVEALRIHHNDPKWIQDFFKALGTKRNAELINNVASSGNYPGSPESAAYAIGIVRQTLTNMARSGNLTQGDMDNLVRNLSKGGLNPYVVTEVFAKLPDESLKNSFVNSAIKLGGDDLNAAAVHVLARTSPANQAKILGPLQQAGKLDEFLKSADAGSKKIETFASIVKRHGSTVPNPEFETYGGSQRLSLNTTLVPPVRDERITTLPFNTNEGIPTWRQDDLQGRAEALWLKYEKDGSVSFNDFGDMLNEIAGMDDLTEREKANLWTRIANSKDQHNLSLDGLRKENVDSYFSSQSAGHIVLGFDDGYHCPLAMLSPDEANRKIMEHENYEGSPIKKWASRIIFGGPNQGDIKASQNQVEALRAYREGGFKAYAEAWNRLFLNQPRR